MLNRSERAVLSAIINKAEQRESVLISCTDILCSVKIKGITEKKIDSILDCLMLDGYIDLILSDRHGQIVYCITLLSRAKAFKRENEQTQRYLIYRGLVALSSAVITYVIGKLLVYFLG